MRQFNQFFNRIQAILMALSVILFSAMLWAQEVVAPVLPVIQDGADGMVLLNAAMALMKNWKLWGIFGSLSVLLMLAMQLVKVSPILGGWLEKKGAWVKQSVLVILGQLAALCGVLYMGGGHNIGAALVGLISSGGAVALYEALKPFWKKKA